MDEITVEQTVLSIDCAVGNGSLAVLKGAKVLGSTAAGTFQPSRAEEVLVAINDLLQRSGLVIAEVERLVVSTGPGSYSGIRIGMATALGLGKAMQKTPVGVSILDSLALTETNGRYLTAVEVGKGHVASAEFLAGGSGEGFRPASAPVLETDTEFLKRLEAVLAEKIVWTDGLSSRLSKHLSARVESGVPDQTIAELTALFAMRFPARTSLAPLYLRDQQLAKNE